jgi:ABC-type polysaccharide/polyol phosphate transport system ATPase subunit
MPSPGTCSPPGPAIELSGVGVRYRLPHGNTRSIKELALLWLRRRTVFDELWALRDVGLSVSRGERLGVIGRNGAGKSTLLQVIARVLAPTTGVVNVRGRVAPLLLLGAGFDPELTGRENVFLNGALLGMRRAEIRARFESIVDFAELHEFVDVPLRAYSSGMAARLGFAVATAAELDVLLLDEVLSVGDEAFEAKCLARMRQFAERGTTMVLVTHDTDDIVEHCTRAIWLQTGQLQADGDPAEVVEVYRQSLVERAPAPLVG